LLSQVIKPPDQGPVFIVEPYNLPQVLGADLAASKSLQALLEEDKLVFEEL
jgi:hypothetical protein